MRLIFIVFTLYSVGAARCQAQTQTPLEPPVFLDKTQHTELHHVESPPTPNAGSPSPLQLTGYAAPKPGGRGLATPELEAWLTRLIRDNLPDVYEDDKKWGETKEVWNGVRLRREGFRVETERRIRTVNTGTWTRYKIEIVNPDETLVVQFHRLEPLENGDIAFGVTVDCPMDVFGRLSQWVRDVQVISISANADAAARLTVTGTVGVEMNVFKFPPDVAIKPKVDTAHVELTHYRVRRISQIGGDFAKVLGDGLRNVVDRKLEDFNAKLVDKMNKQIEKQADKLSFSPQAWLKTKLPFATRKEE